ncbi:MAG: hypothetical protein MHM6MM_007947 [Cercozoa sp. M6MM]
MKFLIATALAAVASSVVAQCNSTDASGLYALLADASDAAPLNVVMACSDSKTNLECAQGLLNDQNITALYNPCECTGAFAKAYVGHTTSECQSQCKDDASSQACIGCLSGQDAGVGLNYTDVFACSQQGMCDPVSNCSTCEAATPGETYPAGHCDALYLPANSTVPGDNNSTMPNSTEPVTTAPPAAPECELADRFGLAQSLGVFAGLSQELQTNVSMTCLLDTDDACAAKLVEIKGMFTECACTVQFVKALLMATQVRCKDPCNGDLTSAQCVQCVDEDNALAAVTGVGFASTLSCGTTTPDASCGFSEPCASCGACASRPAYPEFVKERKCTRHAEDKCGVVTSMQKVLSSMDTVASCFADCQGFGSLTDQLVKDCATCVSDQLQGAMAGCECVGTTVATTLSCADLGKIQGCGDDAACVAESLRVSCKGSLVDATGLPIELFVHPVVTATECPTPATETFCTAEGVDLRENPDSAAGLLTAVASAVAAAGFALN